jgi:hypothetical protein
MTNADLSPSLSPSSRHKIHHARQTNFVKILGLSSMSTGRGRVVFGPWIV